MNENSTRKRAKQLIYIIFIAILNVFCQLCFAQNTVPSAVVASVLPNRDMGSFAAQQFYLAVKQNNVAAVRSGLQKGFSPLALDAIPPHNSALHWAVWENAGDALAVLLQELLKQKDVDVDALNGVGETPLMIAALKGDLPLMRQLIAAGAYPNKEGWTPLHYAATNGHVGALKLLLDEHAYIDAQSPNQSTPLMLAAASKNILAVKLLLDEGADFEAKNALGWSAITFAQKAGATEIAEGLQLREAALKARQSKPAWLR